MITVEVTSTNYIVNATESSYNVTVTADNSIFTVTNVTPSFTVTNVTPQITFLASGSDFDFISKNKGPWISGERYYRNDVVYYEYSTYICGVDQLAYIESSTPPPQDPTNWELFIFHEWPNAYLTVTNWLNVGTTATINRLVVTGNASVTGTLTVSSSTSIGGNLDVLGNFNLLRNLTAANGTFTNSLTVGTTSSTGTFTINGLQYPQNKGTYGQVLYTNGTTDAAWVNLGELTFWELSEDLKTVGFNIVSNSTATQLTIGSGQTGAFHNSIKFNAFNVNSGRIDVTGTTRFANNVRVIGSIETDQGLTSGGDIEIWYANTLRGNAGTNFPASEAFVNVYPGFRFPDGTTQTSALGTPLPIATTSTLGGIIVGNYLTINTATGLLSVNTTTLSSAVLNTATATLLGGIKVGPYLSINPSTGVLTVNTATLGPALIDITLPIASDTVLGGVRIESGSDNINVGLQINPANGNLSLRKATGVVLGGIKVGSGLDITADGILSFNGATPIGNISLDQDMETNYYKIRLSTGYPNTYMLLNNDGVGLVTPNTSTQSIQLKSPVVLAGYDIYNSKVQASAYYSFDGTGAAFFPANVKFSDDTIQRTAWRGYDQGLI
jgi:hypothetical protein